MNEFARTFTALVGCLALLGITVRAAGSVSGEREQDTLLSLVSTPLTESQILIGKWLGAFLSNRGAWVWLLLIWGFALFAGGLHPLAILCLTFAWFSYAALAASLGIWFSVVCRSSMRATLASLATLVMLGGGHWAIQLFCCILPGSFLIRGWGGGDFGEGWLAFFAGLTIPAVLGVTAFREVELNDMNGRQGVFMFMFTFGAFVGVLLSLGLAFGLYRAAVNRFRHLTGRDIRRLRKSELPASFVPPKPEPVPEVHPT